MTENEANIYSIAYRDCKEVTESIDVNEEYGKASTMMRQLRITAKKHENDKLHTFDTDISLMCTDVANRLEELEKEKQEIRNKAIDEVIMQLEAEVESSAKFIREYDDSIAQKAYYKGLSNALKIAEEMRGAE